MKAFYEPLKPFLLCLRLLIFVSLATFSTKLAAETLYFVSLAKIKPSGQQNYERFLTDVTPIWTRHHMKVLLRVGIDPKDRNQILDLDEVAVLKVRSRKDFRAYIEDPDYQKIKQGRLQSVDFFAVMEGNEANIAQLDHTLEHKAVQVAFRDKQTAHNGISVKIELVGPVKGPVPDFLKSVRSVAFEAVSASAKVTRKPNSLKGRIIR